MKKQFWCEPAAKAHTLAMAAVTGTRSLCYYTSLCSPVKGQHACNTAENREKESGLSASASPWTWISLNENNGITCIITEYEAAWGVSHCEKKLFFLLWALFSVSLEKKKDFGLKKSENKHKSACYRCSTWNCSSGRWLEFGCLWGETVHISCIFEGSSKELKWDLNRLQNKSK